MSNRYILTSILVMAVVTYLIRMLPMAIFRKKIKNRFIQSFLSYVPYSVLAAMTFPAVFGCFRLLPGGHDLSGHFFRHRDAAQRLRGNCGGRGTGLF